jgi:hypothetical protein
MTTKALFVRLEAKAGKENEVAKFLRDAQGLVAPRARNNCLVRHTTWPNHLRHLRRIFGRCRTRRTPVGKGCQGADAESARPTGRAADD